MQGQKLGDGWVRPSGKNHVGGDLLSTQHTASSQGKVVTDGLTAFCCPLARVFAGKAAGGAGFSRHYVMVSDPDQRQFFLHTVLPFPFNVGGRCGKPGHKYDEDSD